MMILGILVMITALSISAVAIYYSVAGLMTIFAAAAIPIMIMGGTLEIGKLVTAVWLHRYWKEATWWLKTYLTTAVVVLMFITSMGIFGFLSKAHIEQTASAKEGIAQLERIETEIVRQEAVIARAEQRIEEARNADNTRDAELQVQIDKEQERINSAYARVQPAIDEQLAAIEAERVRTEQRVSPIQSEVDSITTILNDLQTAINAGDIERAQGIVGTAVDGDYGPNTARAVEDFRAAQLARRDSLVAQIDKIKTEPNPIADNARAEIQRLRGLAEQQIADSNTLIERLRSQLGQGEAADIDVLVDEQTARITQANNTIDTLTEQRYTLEAEYRKLEAEVGPVKYIAEFIYGEEANTNLLEEAVRWVILIIIFVFDPLAVLLLIASQHTFMMHSKRKDDQKELLRQQEWEEYERQRAQRIVDNPGYHTGDPAPTQEEEKVDEVTTEKEGSGDTAEVLNGDGLAVGTYTGDSQPVPEEQTDNTEQDEERVDDDTTVETADTDADATVRDMVSEDNVSVDDATEQAVEQDEVQPNGLTPDEIARDYSQVEQTPVEKKDIESSEELKQVRTEELEAQDNDANWTEAKRTWKEAHPDLTLKEFKEKYVNGEIDHLPWEDYVADSKKKTYIMKQGNQQIRKTTD
jgi:peptidoglycan hydrolase-like protein with peptidoglycan-binding domain